MLIVPTPNEEVTIVVPCIHAADTDEYGEGVALLTVTDSTSHEVYSGEVDITEITPFSLNIPDIKLGLPAGQYTYAVTQGTAAPLSLGILQVGLTPAEQQTYEYNPEVIRYERDNENN